MSTLKTVNIQHPSASTPAITLDSAGAMIGSFPYPNRNLIYNGAMNVHQRSSSVSALTSSSYNTADRWQLLINSMGTWTQTIESDAPTGSGFRKSLKMLCTTADPSPAAGEFLYIGQKLEGQDVQRIKKGTSSAEPLVVSFWAKSNVTGTYVVELEDTDNGRTVSKSYSITQSGAWERKVINFPADTSGAFNNDAEMSLVLGFWLGAGSNFTSGTLQQAWGSTVAANRVPGQVNLSAATNNYWQITGIQMETGNAPTPYEFKSYGQELRECQRYFEVLREPFGTGRVNAGNDHRFFARYTVTKRAIPTSITYYGQFSVSDMYTADRVQTSPNTAGGTQHQTLDGHVFVIAGATISGGTFGNGAVVHNLYNSSSNAQIWVSSEL